MECVSAAFNTFKKFQVVDGLQTWSRKDGLLCVFVGKNGQLINNSINRQFYTADIGYSCIS